MTKKKPSEKIRDFLYNIVIEDNGNVAESDIGKVEKFINNNGSSALSITKAHAQDHEGSRSQEDILDTILDRETKRHLDGQFNSKAAQMGAVCETLYNKRQSIDRYKDIYDTGYGNNVRYSIAMQDYFDEDTKSTGFMEINSFIYPYETKSCATVILKNDKTSADSPLGITAQTIYPGWAYVPYDVVKQVDGQESKKFQVFSRGLNGLKQNSHEFEKELRDRYEEYQSKDRNRLSPEEYAYYGIKSGLVTIPDTDILPVLKKTKMYRDASKVEKFCYELKCDRQLAHPGSGKYDPNKPSDITIERPKTDSRYGDKPSFTIHKKIPDGEFRIFVEDNRQFIIRRYKNDPSNPDPRAKIPVSAKIFVPPVQEYEKNKVKNFMDQNPEQKEITQLAMDLYSRFHKNDGREKGIELQTETHKELAMAMSI